MSYVRKRLAKFKVTFPDDDFQSSMAFPLWKISVTFSLFHLVPVQTLQNMNIDLVSNVHYAWLHLKSGERKKEIYPSCENQ